MGACSLASVQKHTVRDVRCATRLVNLRMRRQGLEAQRRNRLFASLQHLESLWFMWEIWKATARAYEVIVSKLALRKCSWLRS